MGTDVDEKTKCNTCNEKDCFVINTKNQKQKAQSKWIACDLCESWYHGTCQDLLPTEVQSVTKLDTKGVKWYCDTCLPCMGKTDDENKSSTAQYSNTIGRLQKIEQSISQLTKGLTLQKEIVEEKLDFFKKSYAAALQSNSENIQKSLEVNSAAKHLISKNIQQNETDMRKKNAILYGVPENKEKSTNDLISELAEQQSFQHNKRPLKVMRLGQHTEGKTRPIKMEFCDEEGKWEFLKRVNSTLRGDHIFCKLDISKEMRDKEYATRKELRALKVQNSDAEYRIRNNIIQTKTDKGDWVAANKENQENKGGKASSATTV